MGELNFNKGDLNIHNLSQLEKLISNIKYGSITLIIQDGVLVQVEKNEKIRLK